MFDKRTIILILASLVYMIHASAQQIVVVDEIGFEGNKKTKEHIILNELLFNIGDSIDLYHLGQVIEESENNLLNTGLFTMVEIELQEVGISEKVIRPMIKVKEAYNFLILPRISIEAESFNTWWTTHNRSFDRLNWGLYAKLRNLTGKRDELRFEFTEGFTQQYSLRYRSPFFHNNKYRLTFNTSYSANRDIDVNQEDHEIISFEDDDRVIVNRWRGEVQLSYRPQLRVQHRLSFGFRGVEVDKDVLEINPELLGGERSDKNYYVGYSFLWDQRDNRFYPRKGFHVGLNLTKDGLLKNNAADGLVIVPEFSLYAPLRKGMIFEHRTRFSVNLNADPNPYYFMEVLGDDYYYIRGYELYSFRSDDYWVAKNSLHFPILNKEINFGKYMPWRSYKIMPFRAFLTANMDFARVNNHELNERNSLYDKTLFGGGLGLNLLLYEQFTLAFEYNINNDGEQGLYLHFRTDL